MHSTRQNTQFFSHFGLVEENRALLAAQKKKKLPARLNRLTVEIPFDSSITAPVTKHKLLMKYRRLVIGTQFNGFAGVCTFHEYAIGLVLSHSIPFSPSKIRFVEVEN